MATEDIARVANLGNTYPCVIISTLVLARCVGSRRLGTIRVHTLLDKVGLLEGVDITVGRLESVGEVRNIEGISVQLTSVSGGRVGAAVGVGRVGATVGGGRADGGRVGVFAKPVIGVILVILLK